MDAERGVRATFGLVAVVLALTLVSCRTPGTAPEGSEVLFYGTDARRAEMTFSTTLYFPLPVGYQGDVGALYQDGEMREAIDEAINLQLQHMFGAFVNHTKPFDFTQSPGIPRERPEIKVTKTERVQGHAAAYVQYTYKDITVFKKSVFSGSDHVTIKFLLPKDPTAIYSKGLVPIAKAKQIYADDEWALLDLKHLKQQGEEFANLCTDLHYNGEGDYWYFWNPHQLGCPQSTRDGTQVIEANLRPLNSTQGTYPRYDTLYGDNGNGDEMRITFLAGIDENWHGSDLGVQGFKKTFAFLRDGKALLDRNDVEEYLAPGEIALLKATPDDADVRFTVLKDENRHKTLRFEGDGYKVLLNMYLVDPNSDQFVNLAVKGMRESDVFVYDGHSGLGGYLSVGRLFENRQYTIPRDKYQVFFFNGCSTFSYYNYDYFGLKQTDEDPRGTSNLDIVTTATPALFSRGPGTDAWLIRSLAGGQRPTWQKVIDDIYKIAAEESALVHVNGDEDNPREPTE
jgi:hypothetical protein